MAKKNVAVARTPLADSGTLELPGYRQAEAPPCAKIIIRGDSGDEAFISAIQKATAATLPVQPNTTAAQQENLLLWLGPDEWMLQAPDKKRAKTIQSLQKAVAGQHAAIIDISDYHTIIRLSGEKAPAVLSHGCPLDLRPAIFPVNQCAQSRFRNAAILLHKTDEEPAFNVLIRRSFADYLWRYLSTVAKTDANG